MTTESVPENELRTPDAEPALTASDWACRPARQFTCPMCGATLREETGGGFGCRYDHHWSGPHLVERYWSNAVNALLHALRCYEEAAGLANLLESNGTVRGRLAPESARRAELLRRLLHGPWEASPTVEALLARLGISEGAAAELRRLSPAEWAEIAQLGRTDWRARPEHGPDAPGTRRAARPKPAGLDS